MKYLIVLSVFFVCFNLFSNNYKMNFSNINFEDTLSRNKAYNPHQQRFFIQAGYTAIASTSLWSNYTNMGYEFNLGNRFIMKNLNPRGSTALEITWFGYRDYFSKNSYNIINSFTALGAGPIYIRQYAGKKHIELGFTLSTIMESFKTIVVDRSLGLMLNPKIRFGYDRLFLNLNGGISMTIGSNYALYSAFASISFGFYI